MNTNPDVVFVNPGNRKQIYQKLGDEFCAIEPPVFPGLYATYLRTKGMSAEILDAPAYNWGPEEVAAKVEELDPPLVAIPVYGFQPSASTQNMSAASATVDAIKAANPNRKILMTGTHAAALPQMTMEQEQVDFVCDLEGPVTIHKATQALKAGVTDFSDVPSLWWRQNGGIVKPNSPEPLVKDLDNEMAGIAWDLLPMDRYRAHNWHSFDDIDNRSPYAAIHTSLGCPYKCSFCCINAPFGTNRYRMWEPQTVIKEIDHVVETYGVTNIKFVDEMFVLNKRHVMGLCDLLISRDYNVNIWAYARVDTVKDGFLDKLKAAGVNWLCLGIESASKFVRDGADKVYTNDDILQVVRKIQDAGIYVLGNYIFGLPDDSIERMQDTLSLALELNCEFANFYSAMAYPGSPLYRMAVEQKLDLPEQWHHFSQHAYDSKPLKNDHCSAADILAFRDEAWQTYFTHPNYLDLVKRKFGQNVVEHVNRMTQVALPRRIVEESPISLQRAKEGCAIFKSVGQGVGATT